ncbi:hypothetical protein Nepgr_005337 [Nepenthes gracilis]|uniref:Uncharacterized protein n=1 Tax=Nepenthes gracilis TaxID=150966 RepID=A0AAD3S301_NEPGR|nr:hypothetical protein Nepgr_005337 [Nepenthes gracilis]
MSARNPDSGCTVFNPECLLPGVITSEDWIVFDEDGVLYISHLGRNGRLLSSKKPECFLQWHSLPLNAATRSAFCSLLVGGSCCNAWSGKVFVFSD